MQEFTVCPMCGEQTVTYSTRCLSCGEDFTRKPGKDEDYGAYRPAVKLTLVLTVLLGASAGISAIGAAFDMSEIELLNDAKAGEVITEERAYSNDMRQIFLFIFQIGMLLITMVVFMYGHLSVKQKRLKPYRKGVVFFTQMVGRMVLYPYIQPNSTIPRR
jgi:hypothetical protein